MVAIKTGTSTSSSPCSTKITSRRNSSNAVKSNNNNNNSSASNSWWKRSAASAFRGGISGSIAMILQVVLLMWLRTIVNYQYKHGVGIVEAFQTLYREGGIPRFYRGASFALLTGPISRFGDTAANEGIQDYFAAAAASSSSNTNLPVWAITLLASLTAAMWRVAITPLDTVKTTLQVSGSIGWNRLVLKVSDYGIAVLWDGAFGNWFATLAGHYPWFIVNNWLEQRLPQPQPQESPSVVVSNKYVYKDVVNNQNGQQQQQQQQQKYQRRMKLIRRAFIGFCSSFVSDCVSNGIRVVKTYKQTSDVPLGYLDALLELFNQSGFYFLIRGLGLKLVSNGLSGILFSVLWKMIMERMNANNNGNSNNNNSSNNNTTTNNNDDINKEVDNNINDDKGNGGEKSKSK